MDKKISLFRLIRENILLFFSKNLKRISNQFNNYRDTLHNNIYKQNADFIDLAPVDEVEKGEEYFKALDWALKKDNIYNIAMTGPYGSGKSSIIRAYLKKRPGLKYINISLATFMEVTTETNGASDFKLVEFDEAKIEEGILKQLFYKVDHNKIPQSRYRKLQYISGMGIFLKIVILILLAAITMFYLDSNIYENLSDIINNAASYMHITVVLSWGIASGILIAIIGMLSWGSWMIISKYRVREIKIAEKASFIKNSEDDKSVFNKNMDEIVYFFEATKFDTVFIEDLDRFESTEVFIRLRELNTILNNYENIRRRIVFVYAIKDDMFTDKDRTKFFEFIIPVIPIINSTNSGEAMLKRIDNSNSSFTYEISPEYITKVSPYIDDMRSMNNILNEFIIYKNTLSNIQGLKLIDEQMLSLMILKNLYPKDFSQLQSETGIVKAAFNDKRSFILSECDKIKSEITDLTKMIESIENDNLANIHELKAVMLFYLSNGDAIVYISINSNRYKVSEILTDEFDMTVFNNKRIDFQVINANGNSYHRTVENIDEINSMPTDKKMGYIERWEYLKNSVSEKKQEMQKKIEKLNIMEHKIKSLSIKNIIMEYGAVRVLSEDVRSNKLLVLMLRGGHIDETYANYMNYFHSNSITKDDMNFILGVRNFDAVDFDYHLTQTDQVIDRLLDYEFDHKVIYNFDLLDKLIVEQKWKAKCNLFIRQLATGDDHSWSFINEFVDRTTNQDLFVKLLGNAWYGMWDHIYTDLTLTEDRKLFYLKLILVNLDVEQIEILNSYKNIRKFMESDPDILNKVADINHTKIKEVIEHLKVCFSDLHCDGISDDLLEHIFKHNHYEINLPMLKNIVKIKKPDSLDSFLNSNYTVLRNLEYPPLSSYLNENISQYVERIVLKLETNDSESLDSVINLLEKLIDNIELVEGLINKQDIMLDDFRKCCYEMLDESKESVKKVWDTFISVNKVIASGLNIMNYWDQFMLTPQLINFIEKNIDKLLQMNDKDLITEELIKAVICSDLTSEAYIKFVSHFKVATFDIDFSNFTEPQMRTLIHNNYFEITPERLVEIKDTFPNLSQYFILRNKEVFWASMQDFALEIIDIEGLIVSEETTEDEKLSLLALTLMSNNYEMTLPIARNILEFSQLIDTTLFHEAWTLLSQDERYALFINQIKLFSHEELGEKFKELGGEYDELSDRSRNHSVKLRGTDYNIKLAEYLKSINYLTSINYDKTVEYDKPFNKNELNRFTVRVKKSAV